MNGENTGSTKSTKTITIVVAVIVIIIIALFIFISPSSQTPNSGIDNSAGENTLPPTSTTTNGPTGGAFKEVKDAGKIYEIQMEKGALTPVNTTVAKGDVARLAFSAVDADYSVSFAAPIEMNLTLKKGQAALVPFDAQKNTSGEFTFTIKDSAGKTASGKIIVK